jgi:hypothetical protein
MSDALIEKPEIEKSLVVSTAHITRQDSELLDLYAKRVGSQPLIVFNKEEYGWWVAIIRNPDEAMLPAAVSEDLRNLLNEAKRRECQWLVLDRDGPEYPELPTHDW